MSKGSTGGQGMSATSGQAATGSQLGGPAMVQQQPGMVGGGAPLSSTSTGTGPFIPGAQHPPLAPGMGSSNLPSSNLPASNAQSYTQSTTTEQRF